MSDVEKTQVKNTEVTREEKKNTSPPAVIVDYDDKYAALMETNGQECESWLYFIKYKGNEENLKHLNNQLEDIDWYILDDLSTFDLDLEHLVSSKTAKEMTKLELNSYAFHRKFDGKLQKINIKIKKKDNNEKKMVRVFDILGYGQIEDFVDKEDIDEEDLTSSNETSSEDDTESDRADDISDSDDSSDDEKVKTHSKKGIPSSLLNSNLPRFAKAKRRYKNTY